MVPFRMLICGICIFACGYSRDLCGVKDQTWPGHVEMMQKYYFKSGKGREVKALIMTIRLDCMDGYAYSGS